MTRVDENRPDYRRKEKVYRSIIHIDYDFFVNVLKFSWIVCKILNREHSC